MRESTLLLLQGLRSRASVSGPHPEPGLWPAGVACPAERTRDLAKAAGKRGGNGARGAMLTPVWEEGCSKYKLFTQAMRCSSPLCGGESKNGREGERARTGEKGKEQERERRGETERKEGASGDGPGTEARRGPGILLGLEKRILPNNGGLGTTCRRLRPTEGRSPTSPAHWRSCPSPLPSAFTVNCFWRSV